MEGSETALRESKGLSKRLLSITILSFHVELKITGFTRIFESFYESPRLDCHRYSHPRRSQLLEPV